MNQIECYIPKWLETLPQDHELKQQMIQIMQKHLQKEHRDTEWAQEFAEEITQLPFVKKMFQEETDAEKDRIRFQISVKEEYYYQMLSEMSGIEINGEYELISLLMELGGARKEYEGVQDAMKAVRETGYGILLPDRKEIQWEEPVITHSNNRYGVKMKAVSPTIHLIRAEVTTEIAPIVGSKKQAEDLIQYIKEGTIQSDGIWKITIFGKTVEQLMQEEMTVKVNQLQDDSRLKIQKAISRVLDESRHGIICLII